MRAKTKHTKSSDAPPLFKWKGLSLTTNNKKDENRFPITEFLRNSNQTSEEGILGPGGGAGIGCGVGLGFGLVGGMGYGGWPWNHLNVAFGVGMGCGVGFGIGYGQGFGYGFSFDSLKSHLSSRRNPNSKRRVVIQI